MHSGSSNGIGTVRVCADDMELDTESAWNPRPIPQILRPSILKKKWHDVVSSRFCVGQPRHWNGTNLLQKTCGIPLLHYAICVLRWIFHFGKIWHVNIPLISIGNPCVTAHSAKFSDVDLKSALQRKKKWMSLLDTDSVLNLLIEVKNPWQIRIQSKSK